VRIWGTTIVALFLAWPATTAAAPPPARPGAPISAHAMVHTCCTPLPMKERIFAEAKAMSARYIRVDVELAGIFTGGGNSEDDPDWSRLDAVLELSRRHELPILGILLRPPGAAPWDDPEAFGRLAAAVAAHARDTVLHWEILNEPDGAWAFDGTPEQYARLLRAAYDAIGARVPEATLAMGGLMTPGDPAWLDRMLATPGADAVHAFDIANLHLRGHERGLPGVMTAWRDRLAGHGFTGPVWVTEHGYPGDAAFQTDPVFHGGEAAQAAYLTESVLSLGEAGAAEVFVTLRDNLDGGFASEGVVDIEDHAPFAVRRKPSFSAVRRLVDRWGELIAARVEQRRAEEAAGLELATMAAWRLKAAGYRAAARPLAAKLRRLRARHRRARRKPVRARLGRQIDRTSRALRGRRFQILFVRAVADQCSLRAALHQAYAADRAAFVAGR
jgi:hypothetical protein